MASKRKKAHYECKQKVCCLSCGDVILSEQQQKHTKAKHIISKFKSRFAENDSVVLCALANILTNENPDDEAFKEMAKFYTIDEDTIKSEHKMFNHMKKTLTDTKSVSGMLKQIADKQMMIMIPELFKLIKIFAVIPATSCSAERSFSSLRRLKTYLRKFYV